jgi:hypothetical protein
MLGDFGSVDQTVVYFDMPFNVTLEEKVVKMVLITGLGSEKTRITVMLSVLTNDCKLPPYLTLQR